MALRISDLKPEEAAGLEDLNLWGLKPVLPVLEHVSRILGEDSDPEEQNYAYVMLNDVKIKIEDTIEKLEEFDVYYCKVMRQLENATVSQQEG